MNYYYLIFTNYIQNNCIFKEFFEIISVFGNLLEFFFELIRILLNWSKIRKKFFKIFRIFRINIQYYTINFFPTFEHCSCHASGKKI